MSEDSAAPEDDPGTGSDPTDDSSSEPIVPEGYVSQVQLDAAEARRRSFQSENDRLKAEIAQLKASGDATPKPDPVVNPTGMTVEQIRAEFARHDMLREAKHRISQDFGLARPEVLGKEYPTAEEFIAAAERSHNEVKAERDAIAAAAAKAEREALLKAHPELKKTLVPDTPSSDNGSTGALTLQDWLKMSNVEKAAISDDELQKILNTA